MECREPITEEEGTEGEVDQEVALDVEGEEVGVDKVTNRNGGWRAHEDESTNEIVRAGRNRPWADRCLKTWGRIIMNIIHPFRYKVMRI